MDDLGCESWHIHIYIYNPKWPWGPHSLPFGGYRSFSPREKAVGA